MKRLLFAFFAALCAAGMSAEVLLVESFEYDVPLDGTVALESMPQWAAPWGGTSGITLTTPLAFDNYVESDKGGAALIDCDSQSGWYPQREFATITSGSLYVAFMFLAPENYNNGYFLSLRCEPATVTSDFNYLGRVYITEDYHFGLRVFKNEAAQFDATLDINPNKVYLVVLKYEIVPGGSNRFSLYAMDKWTDYEPASPLVGPLTDAAATNAIPNQIALRGYDKDSWLSVDGIRVATTWAEAVKGILPPAPPEALENMHSAAPRASKRFVDGQLVIRRADIDYNAIGQQL